MFKKIFKKFQSLRSRFILWNYARWESRPTLSYEIVEKHIEYIFAFWNTNYFAYQWFWEYARGARVGSLQWYIFSEMCWDGDRLSKHFWVLTSLLIFYYAFYYVIFYRRRVFYEEKRKSETYEKYKYLLRISAYGYQKALKYYFDLDKKILEIRANIYLFEIIDEIEYYISERIFELSSKYNVLLTDNFDKIVLKIIRDFNSKGFEFNEEGFLYNLDARFIFRLLLAANKKTISKDCVDPLKIKESKIFFFYEELLEIMFAHQEIFEALFSFNMIYVSNQLIALKKIYEEAYFLGEDVDLDALKKKYEVSDFQEGELIYFANYNRELDLLEAHEKKLKQEAEDNMI